MKKRFVAACVAAVSLLAVPMSVSAADWYGCPYGIPVKLSVDAETPEDIKEFKYQDFKFSDDESALGFKEAAPVKAEDSIEFNGKWKLKVNEDENADAQASLIQTILNGAEISIDEEFIDVKVALVSIGETQAILKDGALTFTQISSKLPVKASESINETDILKQIKECRMHLLEDGTMSISIIIEQDGIEASATFFAEKK